MMRWLLGGCATMPLWAPLLGGCATVPLWAPKWNVDIRVAVVTTLPNRHVAYITAAIDVPRAHRPLSLTVHRDGELLDVWTCKEDVCQGTVTVTSVLDRASVLVVGVEDHLGYSTFTTVELSRPVRPLRPPSRPTP